MAEFRIRPLSPNDDRSRFASGQADLDRFFQHYAGQNQFKLGLATTYVALAEEELVGFATVTGGSLDRDEVADPRLRKRLPKYPLPILRLARLAVDLRAQGTGVGTALLRHVLHIALLQRDRVCLGVVADAKPHALPFYEAFGFQKLAGVRMGAVHGAPVPMILGMKTIAKAIPDP